MRREESRKKKAEMRPFHQQATATSSRSRALTCPVQLKAVNFWLILGRVLRLAALRVHGVQHVGKGGAKVHAVRVLVTRGLSWGEKGNGQWSSKKTMVEGFWRGQARRQPWARKCRCSESRTASLLPRRECPTGPRAAPAG